MPESADKQELGGLARSIDSLFSSAAVEPALAPVAEGADEPETSEEASSGTEVPLASEGDAELAVAGEPEIFGGEIGTEPEHAAGVATEPEPAAEDGGSQPQREATAEETAEVDGDVGFELEPEAAFEEPAAAGEDLGLEPEPEAEAEGIVGPPAPDTGDAAVAASTERTAEDPTPLDLAVGSYLAGGGDEARVSSLAEQALEARDYDGVASAVERLVEGAEGPSAHQMVDLAAGLLSPIVTSRIVQRMGPERDEGRRAVLFSVCTALGQVMAEAIRDEMAETPDRGARRVYFDALVAMGDVSRPVIEAMAEDDNVFLARNAVAILGETGGPRAEELVVAAVWNSDRRVRREAARAMARLEVEDAEQLVMELLSDSEESVRLAATVTAGELKIERAVRVLTSLLDESYETEAVLPLLHALGQIGDPGAVASIEKHATKDRFGKPRTEVRIAAYQALNHIGTPHARRLLNQALSDKDPAVKAMVKQLLHIR